MNTHVWITWGWLSIRRATFPTPGWWGWMVWTVADLRRLKPNCFSHLHARYRDCQGFVSSNESESLENDAKTIACYYKLAMENLIPIDVYIATCRLSHPPSSFPENIPLKLASPPRAAPFWFWGFLGSLPRSDPPEALEEATKKSGQGAG